MARSDVLVTTDWAESNLDAPNTVFVEVDEDTSAYDGGHIAGAVKLDWKTDLQDPVKRDFVDAQQFSKLLSDKGISNDDTVILYGGNNNWFAAYAYWYFKLYGHENVKLLDGGRKKWELDGRPLVHRRAVTGRRPATPPRRRTTASARSATRSSRRSTRRTWSTCAPPTSSPARSSPRRTCRRSRASGPGISRAPSTFRGARRPTRTAPSSPTRTWPSCTPKPGWTARRRPSRTAASVSARRTPGSCCRSCSGTRTSRTTTAVGRNTAPWWVAVQLDVGGDADDERAAQRVLRKDALHLRRRGSGDADRSGQEDEAVRVRSVGRHANRADATRRLRRQSGGASGTRTPDLRIMIPSL